MIKFLSASQIEVEAIVADLATPLLSRLTRGIDLLVFNPPYVPTEDSEAFCAQDARGIEGSWAGGSIGMQVTDRLLDQLDVCHFLASLSRLY